MNSLESTTFLSFISSIILCKLLILYILYIYNIYNLSLGISIAIVFCVSIFILQIYLCICDKDLQI